jgi:hypothetical protein
MDIDNLRLPGDHCVSPMAVSVSLESVQELISPRSAPVWLDYCPSKQTAPFQQRASAVGTADVKLVVASHHCLFSSALRLLVVSRPAVHNHVSD